MNGCKSPVIAEVSRSDENCQMYQQPDLNSNKIAKNFMSPAKVSASDGVPKRKNILAERNESTGSIISAANVSKSPILYMKDSVKNSKVEPLTSQLSEFKDSPSPSPRPRFVRYNPNRLRGILQDSHKDDAEMIASNSSQAEIGELEDEEFEEVEDEEEGWVLRGILKSLMLFVVLVYCTLYISSMNSEAPSPALQALEGLRGGYQNLQDHVFGALKGVENSGNFFGEFAGMHHGLVELNQTFIVDAIEGAVYPAVELQKEAETEGGVINTVEVIEDDEECIVKDGNVGAVELVVDLGEAAESESGQIEVVDDGNKGAVAEWGEELQNLKTTLVSDKSEEIEPNMMDDEIYGSDSDIFSHQVESKSEEETTGANISFETLIGIFLLLPIVSYLALSSFMKAKPHSESVIAEKATHVHQIEEEEKFEDCDLPIISANFIPSAKYDIKELYHSSAPKVELLGEFLVSKPRSSVKKRLERKVDSVPIDSEPEFTKTSHLVGSFISEKRVSKKQDVGCNEVVTTPVRRSSRIRNNAVMSP